MKGFADKHPFNIFQLIPDRKVKQFIFIDEVQYLDNPTNFLKLLFDERRDKIKIIASGSSSFYIDKKFKDSLSGRKFLYEIYPLNFDEFLVFNKEDELKQQKRKKLLAYQKEKLLSLWERYILFGGYPKVALAEDDDMREIMLEEIGTGYIKKDVFDAGIKNSEKYFTLLRILSEQTGQLVNLQELAATIGMARKTVEEYLYVMEKSYQIAFIRPFYKNLRKELTKMPKIYFYDIGLRNFFLNNYNKISTRSDRGAYLENIIFKELMRKTGNIDKIKFWRTQDKREVDFVVEEHAYEVKFSIREKEKNKYRSFNEQYPQIPLTFLTYETVLKTFYQWKL